MAASNSGLKRTESAAPGEKFNMELFQKMTATIRHASDLPVDTEYRYQLTQKDFCEARDKAAGILIEGLSDICKWLSDGAPPSARGVKPFKQAQTTAQKWQTVIHAVDHCLETVDISLDKQKGYDRFARPKVATHMHPDQSARSRGGRGGHNMSNKHYFAPGRTFGGMPRSRNSKPQDRFEVKPDNSTEVWKPIIDSKPNAIVPFELSIKPTTPLSGPGRHKGWRNSPYDVASPSSLPANVLEHLDTLHLPPPAKQLPSYPHPYEAEIRQLRYPEDQLLHKPPISPDDECECIWVDTVAQVHELAEDLENQREFAVDLEHHDFRSYLGLTCLMQISTRSRDYIIDTLELRGKLQPLLKSFTDPKICKVLHGSLRDVLWLQRDLGLYVVNMFDTYCAARMLQSHKFSFAFLLKEFCNITADKRFQKSDWRVRPLSKESLEYARMDTHYLLYIYDKMRNLLLEKAREDAQPRKTYLLTVLSNSKTICLKTYQKPRVNATSHIKFCTRHIPNQYLSPAQSMTLQGLLEWRDEEARVRDESTRYILTNEAIIRLLEKLPQEPLKVMEVLQRQLSHGRPIGHPEATKIAEKISECVTMAAKRSKRGFFMKRIPSAKADSRGSSDDEMPGPKLPSGGQLLSLGCLSNPAPGTADWGRRPGVSGPEDTVKMHTANASYSVATPTLFAPLRGDGRPKPPASAQNAEERKTQCLTPSQLMAITVHAELQRGVRIGVSRTRGTKRRADSRPKLDTLGRWTASDKAKASVERESPRKHPQASLPALSAAREVFRPIEGNRLEAYSPPESGI